jgi:hypothetical protein
VLGSTTFTLLGSFLLASAGHFQDETPQAAPELDLAGSNWLGRADTPVAPSFIALEFPSQDTGQVRLTMPSALALGKLVDLGGEPGAPTISLAAGGRTAMLHLEPAPDAISGRMDVFGPDGETVLQGFPLQLLPWSAPEQMKNNDFYIGNLELPGGNELELHLELGYDADTASARLGIPMQSVEGYPSDARKLENGWFIETNFGTPVTMELEIQEDKSLTGTMKQSGAVLPVSLKPVGGDEFNRDRRPQTPKPPFPYKEIEARIDHPDGHVLAGSLLLPDGVENPPVAVMISGSGPQDRDESIMGHSPFLVLADHLARQGIATLRYDDRGFGESTGEFSTALTSDFATDTLAAVGWLRDRDDIDDSAIGLIGHSEGGLVAPMAIAEDQAIAFAVLMAGPGVDGGRILTSQSERIMTVQGTDPAEVAKIIVLHAEMMDLVRNDAPVEELGTGYLALIDAQIASARSELGDEQANQMMADGRAKLAADPQPFTPWMVAFIRTDPREFLSQLSCPVLAINGTRDVQVISEINLPEIERAVTTGGGTIKTIEYDGLNHLFQKSETGAVSEYSTIETTMEPEVLMDISTWILEVTGRSKP